MKGKCHYCGADLVIENGFIGCKECNVVFYNAEGYSPSKIKKPYKIKLTKKRIKELREQEKKAQMDLFPTEEKPQE